jgi:hypothetical protein
MKEINGIKINKLGFHPQKLGDLIYHEGPLLSLFIDKDNPDLYYIFKWADNDQDSNRWIVTQVNSLSLRAFFYKQTSLRDIILNNPVCYSVDIDNDLNEKSVLVCSSTDLPKEYLPGEKSFFSEERYSEFAQTFKTIIANNRIYDILYKILNEIDSIKRNQTQTNSLINLFFRHKPTKQSSYSETVQYSKGMSNYEKILN